MMDLFKRFQSQHLNFLHPKKHFRLKQRMLLVKIPPFDKLTTGLCLCPGLMDSEEEVQLFMTTMKV
jgi:hypothetical protein